MKRAKYSTDLTDKQWEVLSSLLNVSSSNEVVRAIVNGQRPQVVFQLEFTYL